VLLDVHHDCPATIGRMLEMLRDGVVLLLPAIQSSAAKKTHRVIGIAFVGLVIETRMCQLENIIS
jgi:hypothetical protein